MPTVRLSRGPSKADLKRRALRDELWPDAGVVAWDRHRENGFTTVPRTLSLVCALIKDLATPGDPSRAYLDLWMRAWDDHFVVVDDEGEFAFSAGYAPNTRYVRTWRGHMQALEELGFIRVRPKVTRKFGYVLLLHPHDVVQRLRQAGRVPDAWWEMFVNRVREMGAVLRDAPVDADASRERPQVRTPNAAPDTASPA